MNATAKNSLASSVVGLFVCEIAAPTPKTGVTPSTALGEYETADEYVTMLEAEIATAPDTEFEPGRLTPPPASMARLGAVIITPVAAITVEGVVILKLLIFEA